MKKRRILIMAAGTGGHVFPALAVAKVLREQHNAELAWLGTPRGIENEVVPKANIPLHQINVRGLRGNGIKRLVKAPFVLCHALWQAHRVIRQFKPDVVLGFGGFVCGPGGLAAWLNRVPLVIHEQNAIPGLTNKILSRLAKQVLEAFPNTFTASSKLKTVGNPIRQSIAELPPPATRLQHKNSAECNLLILGGSLGAKALNELVPLAVQSLQPGMVVLHQSGKQHIAALQELYATLGVQARCEAFIDNMAEAFAWADLVIARAGASTVCELASAGVGSILVPYPYAVDDHQTANANYLVAGGAAQIIQQADLTVETLVETISQLRQDKTKLLSMAEAARALHINSAAETVASHCLEVVRE